MTRTRKSEISKAAAAMSRMRKTFAGGRPAKLEPCPRCGAMLNATQRHRHAGECAGEPAPPTVKLGRPAVVRPCPKCGKPYTARALKAHRPKCQGGK